jgi:S-methyl-5-thioribose-1-phosphate isomerase
VRTIEWRDGVVVIVDQTVLPTEVRYLHLDGVDGLIDAIRRLAVRGAPALGAAGGLGVAVAYLQAEQRGEQDVAASVRRDAERIKAARPTAVNLAWGVDRVLRHLSEGREAVVAQAVSLLAEDADVNRRIGARGADLFEELEPGRASVLTHCNAGALACVEWGTALGVVRSLHERGTVEQVFATETRPLLQGARLTAFELDQLGIDHRLVVDSAGPSVIARGLVNLVVVGADRIAANGDVVNKVGTYPLALAAARAGVPFVVAAPESTVDLATPTGLDVPIEERPAEEITEWRGVPTAPAGSLALNLAFDVTPAELVTAIVTERRVIRPASGERPSDDPASIAAGG